MQYNSEANTQDLVTEIRKITHSTANSYSTADITRRFNFALDAYFDLAHDAAGPWPFDDINQSSAAIATQNIQSGVNAYKISSFSGSAIGILGVAILNADATVKNLTGEDFLEIRFEELYTTGTTGTPTHYTKYGDYIYIRPTPDYDETGGLRAYPERNPLYMAVSDTTKEPGIPKKHHMYLCRMTALPYLIDNRMPQAQAIAQLIQEDEKDIQRYYARRDKAMVHRMRPLYQNNK